MVEPHSSNFRVITTNVLGVRIFRKFTVLCILIDCKHTGNIFGQHLNFESLINVHKWHEKGLCSD